MDEIGEIFGNENPKCKLGVFNVESIASLGIEEE